MRIYSYFNENGYVGAVHIVDEEHPNAKDIEEKVKERNKECGYEAYKLFEIPEGMEETITYLFGDKKYKRYAELDDVDDTMNELSASINSIHDDTFDMVQSLERLEKKFEEIKKHFEE